MKIAIVGSRNLIITNLNGHIPSNVSEIVSGGAKGIDSCAEDYATANGLKLTIFKPDYEKYSKAAPLRRSDLIIDYADTVIAFWDGKSKGTKYVIDRCRHIGKEIKVVMLTEEA